jgi:transmembrane sensor
MRHTIKHGIENDAIFEYNAGLRGLRCTQMKNDRVQYLLRKKLSGKCSIKELKELALLTEMLSDEELKSVLHDQWNSFSPSTPAQDRSSRRIIQSILGEPSIPKAIPKQQRDAKIILLRFVSVAASIILIVMAGKFVYQQFQPAPMPAVVIKAEPLPLNEPAGYNRQVVLADGSMVVLRAGSTLDYPGHFSGSAREVILNGEAFFDIARDTSKPFIIRTGNIKTVVLGTAFTIKAWDYEKQVTVSVSRGKVKVEDNEKTLAILTANQQMQYDESNDNIEQRQFVAEELIPGWTHEDLVFSSESLESIAQTLSRHYGVNISISDNDLAGTIIVSSFSGAEPLENILEILCRINGDVHYSIDGKEIILRRESLQTKTKNQRR